jgi:hypothetical protein
MTTKKSPKGFTEIFNGSHTPQERVEFYSKALNFCSRKDDRPGMIFNGEQLRAAINDSPTMTQVAEGILSYDSLSFLENYRSNYGPFKKNLYQCCGNKVTVDLPVSYKPEDITEMLAWLNRQDYSKTNIAIAGVLVAVRKSVEEALK